jgi:transposase
LSQAGFDGDLDSRILSLGEEGFGLMPRPRKYPPELLDRGARLVFESNRPIAHVARDLGVSSETLRRHVRQVEADEGLRPELPTAAEREEIKRLRKEVYELRRANEILKAASVFFATELDADRPK